MNKVFPSSLEAVADIPDGATIMLGGFGLCGIPENLIRAVVRRGIRGLQTISNNMGVEDFGMGLMLAADMIASHVGSYVGENKLLESRVLSGTSSVTLVPQGTLAERIRAGGAGIPAFYTATGVGTVVAEGKETREFGGRTYLLEQALTADFALIKAWKGDTAGNLVYRKTARNFNPVMAAAARVTIAEVEELVRPGELDPDSVITPGIYVHRILKGDRYSIREENRAAGASRKNMRVASFLLVFATITHCASGAACEQLRDLTLPTGTVAAENVLDPDGGSYCRVSITSVPVPDSEIHSEVWLPAPERWNGKLLGTGNGGYSSQMDLKAMRTGLLHGYAVAGSDTGHSGGDLKFAVGHPVKIDDWAYRAIHVMTEAAKLVVRSYYGRFPEHAYFNGCSTGGQQALSEAQRYPLDYDGIVAGDPGNNRIHLKIGFLWSWRVLHEMPEANLPGAKLPMLYRAVMRACDALDGMQDGIISDPRRCHFDPAVLLCNGPDSESCLTAAQVRAIREIYAGARNPRTGEQIFPGWVRGSEYLPDGSGSWAGYFADRPEPARLDFWRYWVFDDPHWEPRTFDFDQDVAFADRTLPHVAAVDADLTAFRRHGGKLLMYQGWADPVVPPEDTVHYYEAVEGVIGGARAVNSFALLFMVPGMGHCTGGPGPNRFDSLSALDAWVVSGEEPHSIVAEHVTNNGAVDRTRPLCPYPQQAAYKGSGSTDDAANFVCSTDALQQAANR